jgi:Xaa-Pro aminopeptidase
VSSWDEGIPDDIPHDHLFGITWNPGNLLAWLKGIDGLAEARRIGTDSLTPRFAKLLPRIFPTAALVDAEHALEAARRIKAPEEIDAIRTALAVAETALAAAVAELRPGVSEHHLAAVFMDAMAHQGVTTPATQQVAWIASRPGPPSRRATATVAADDLVAFDAGVVAGGYTGEVGRTWPADPATVDATTKDLYRQAHDLWGRLLEACRPGTPCSGLLAAYQEAGQAPPPFPVASGLGLGFDTPVVTAQLPQTAAREVLEPDVVLAVTAQVTGNDHRTVFHKEAVRITDNGSEVLTSAPHWSP